MSDLLIIIPAYNEEMNIVNVVDNLISNFSQYDYIVVNDGSRDKTADICRKHNYNLLDLPINLGLAGAFQAGMRYAHHHGYSYAVQLDADGQHLPEYIVKLKDLMQDEYDIIIGSRYLEDKKPLNLRTFGSFIISFAIRITAGQALTDPTSGMRLYNEHMIEEFATQLNYTPEPDTLSYLARNNVKIKETQVTMQERMAGESYLNLKNSMFYMIRMCISIFLIQWFRKRNKKEK